MSLEDLKRSGFTLPVEQWGQHRRSRVHGPLFASAALSAVLSCALMYWGDGGALTWIGAVLFLASLFGVTGLLLQATVSGDAASR